ncbi:MAG TPA: ankyrin repeat domain-containing protein, partial [Candidatus Babeliales bacterium]|nr:ankyrin repeat domain-containing protein [Candidatus Babeliales bacterium]
DHEYAINFMVSEEVYYKKLMHAAKIGDLQKLIQVLHTGVNPDAKDEFTGMTAPMHAASNDHINIVNYLVTQTRADINTKDINGASLLTYLISGQLYTDDDIITPILRLNEFTPEIKKQAAAYARKQGRPDIAKLIESYNQPKAKL